MPGGRRGVSVAISLPQWTRPNPTPRLRDRQARAVGYLRLSLTRGCSMRCVYCRPVIDRNPRGEVRLTPAELEAIVRHLVQTQGLHKVRLTGGDPTVRPDLPQIIARLAAVPGIDDLAMTTNGLTLADQSARYAEAGLHRVNVSLDTLDAPTFARLTGVDALPRVLRGLAAAKGVFRQVKLNCVVVRGDNLHHLPDLVRWAAEQDLPLRLIELMPMGPLGDAWAERFVSEADMRAALRGTVADYDPLPQGADAARRYRVALRGGGHGELGFITPMSCLFCADCNRLRLGADGAVYPCLMDQARGSIIDAVRPRFRPIEFDRVLAEAYEQKAATHPPAGPAVMTHIGG